LACGRAILVTRSSLVSCGTPVVNKKIAPRGNQASDSCTGERCERNQHGQHDVRQGEDHV
jgi:hypothetical protein